MKTLIKFSMYLMAGLMLFASACSQPDEDDINDSTIDPNNYFSYGVKSGKVVYQSTNVYEGETETETFAMIFDDNGKRFRVEQGDNTVIIDGVAGKMYTLDPEEKTYLEVALAQGTEMMYGLSFVYLGDDASSAWGYHSGFTKKSNKTIAGKSCSVVSWTDGSESVEWAGWKRLTFLMRTVTADGSSTLEATSFTESIPANSFTPPADYTKVSY